MKRSSSSSLRLLRLLLVASVLAPSSAEEPPVATTEYGVLQGTHVRAANQVSLPAFLGVPYGRPPTGDLRFRPPESPRSWRGTRLATRLPPSCYQQRDLFFGDFDGARYTEPSQPPSEDCLYLNVYLPKRSSHSRGEGEEEEEGRGGGDEMSGNENGLPVMVWFHGGGFSRGSSSPRGDGDGSPRLGDWSPDPRELAAQGEVVVVSVQYRLGALGFLFLDDGAAPGNAGLWDQRAALGWVRRNIFAFGGDPTRVTLAGQDAGAVSAALQLASARADGSLRAEATPARLIMHSGGVQHPWSHASPAQAFTRALKLSSLLGCPTSGSKREVAGCLARQRPEDIVNKESGVASSPGGLGLGRRNPFVPTVDGVLLREEPRAMMQELLSSGEEVEEAVQLLVGSNEDEGSKALMYLLPSLFPNRELADPGLTREEFSHGVDRILEASSTQVREGKGGWKRERERPNEVGDDESSRYGASFSRRSETQG